MNEIPFLLWTIQDKALTAFTDKLLVDLQYKIMTDHEEEKI